MASKPTLPSPLQALERLSWNYWWSWSADGAGVYRDLDAELWDECEHNPRLLLARVSEYRLAEMATDPVYLDRISRLAIEFDRYMSVESSALSSAVAPAITPENPVAYFCAEFGVHNSLPLYSGGLGVLAGDHLKSASDLRLPLVAVGLLYHYGYFRQRLSRIGWQEELYGETDPEQLPLHQVYAEDGSPLLVEVLIRERTVRAQVWRADIGRVPLYLLDTNIPANEETDRWVTGHLYGGDRETRIVQEMLLGIGGVRLLRKLAIEPRVFHLNEGHSAFLTLELARELIQSRKLSFAEAAKLVRQRSVFTTHTPVAAGNDEFEVDLLTRAFGPTYEKELGLTHDEFVALGRIDAQNPARGLWPDAAGDSHVPVDERREPKARRSFARALAKALAQANVGANSDYARHQRRSRANLGGAAAETAFRQVHNSAIGRPRRATAPVGRRQSREFLTKNCGPRICF